MASENMASQDTQAAGNTSAKLLEIIQDFELFHTPAMEPYASFTGSVPLETLAIDSEEFRFVLSERYYRLYGSPPNKQALEEAIEVIKAKALFDGREREVHTRVAGSAGKVYLDLANEERDIVEITEDGWSIISDPLVKFRRPRGMRPLPLPEHGGSIDLLKPFLNLRYEDFPLVVGILLAALRPEGPFPIFMLTGQQGTAKSTTARVIRQLIDPNVADNRACPSSERDLMISASNSWVVSFDNISKLPDWLSDAFCRLSTGAGLGTRGLYTDDQEKIFQGARPIILNGIGVFGTRGDLLDRSILLILPEIRDDFRQEEQLFWEHFGKAHPLILGALLDAVRCGLMTCSFVELAELPRMADFARWVTSAEPAFGWRPGTVTKAFEANRQEIHHVALEGSVLAEGILALMKVWSEWEGTASELLNQLRSTVPARLCRDLPGGPGVLSRELWRIAPNLKNAGIAVGRGTQGKRRSIKIEQLNGNDDDDDDD